MQGKMNFIWPLDFKSIRKINMRSVYRWQIYLVHGSDLSDEKLLQCVERSNPHDFKSKVQWNLSVTTTSKIKFCACDLFSNVF